MKRILQVVVCAVVIGLSAAGCGGSKAPPPGARGDAGPLIQELLTKANNKKLRSSERGAAIIALGRFGAEAQVALNDLEKIAASEKDKTLKEKATLSIKRIKGEE
ncbi:MAG: hypothetical protein JNG90_14925 [Planctomycetaceae bacterium]|nr:hypothetical protein [Planctomycetaceae bacterium]